jgi:hypothetical protein
MPEGLGDGGLAGGGPADEDDVAVLVDEAAGEEFLDDLGGELGARGPVEALEGQGSGRPRAAVVRLSRSRSARI